MVTSGPHCKPEAPDAQDMVRSVRPARRMLSDDGPACLAGTNPTNPYLVICIPAHGLAAARAGTQKPAAPVCRRPGASEYFGHGSHGEEAVLGSFRGRRRRDANFDELQAEAGDPLQQSLEGALI
jgi:hypothetical protein